MIFGQSLPPVCLFFLSSVLRSMWSSFWLSRSRACGFDQECTKKMANASDKIWYIARQPNNNRIWNHVTIGTIIAIWASYIIPKSMVSFLLSKFFFFPLKWYSVDLRWLLLFLFVLFHIESGGRVVKHGGWSQCNIARPNILTCDAENW